MKILIDNGHGVNTPGKCSPDKALREWAYCREIAQRVTDKLRSAGYNAERIVTEETDTSLSERCRRVNAHCKVHGSKNCMCVSIHNNAAGADGKWHSARGFSVYVAPNASEKSKKLASIFTQTAERMGLMGNRSVPAGKYWVGNFSIVRNTNCPAVLTENLFQDSKEDVSYLLSEEGKEAIATLHFEAIKRYIEEETL